MKTWLKSLAPIALGLHVSACNHLFYHPDAVEYRESGSYPFPVKELEIPREGQGPLHAWLLNDTETSKGLILHYHGNAQNLTAHVSFSDWFASEGYTVLIFDYSGYGKTEGEPTQNNLVNDSRALARYLVSHDRWSAKGLPFVVFAQSLGGAVATVSLAEIPELREKVDLLVVESSFDSYRHVAFRKLTESPISWLFSPLAYVLVGEDVKPGEAIARLTMPKIIVHGSADRVVPFENGKDLYEAAKPPKEFWEIPYGNHTEGFISGSPYRAELLKKIKDLKLSP